MLYIYKENHFIRRGSPLGSTEAGVYAYTEVKTIPHLINVCHSIGNSLVDSTCFFMYPKVLQMSN